MQLQLSGLIAAPFTPLHESGDLNLAMIPKLLRLYEKNGVAGSFICGSTGEGSSLTLSEKRAVMEAWGDEKNTTVKKIFMVGGTSLREMKQLAVEAQNHEMDAISFVSPYYFRPKEVDRLVDCCEEVGAAVPDMPLFYYHIPSLTHAYFSMHEFLEKCEDRVPNLVGIKFSHSDLFDFQKCRIFREGKYQMLWGTDEALLSALAAGAQGGVGSTYNYAAPLYHKIIKAFEESNFDEARLWQNKAVQMVGLLIKYGGAEAGKAFMKIIGLDCGWCRLPMKRLSTGSYQGLEKELQEIGFFDYCSKI